MLKSSSVWVQYVESRSLGGGDQIWTAQVVVRYVVERESLRLLESQSQRHQSSGELVLCNGRVTKMVYCVANIKNKSRKRSWDVTDPLQRRTGEA